MKKIPMIVAALTLLGTSGCNRQHTRALIIITASIDQFGHHHLGGTSAHKGAIITCIEAGGVVGASASCAIKAPGFGGPLNVTGAVTATDAGPVSLDCLGPNLTECSASVL